MQAREHRPLAPHRRDIRHTPPDATRANLPCGWRIWYLHDSATRFNEIGMFVNLPPSVILNQNREMIRSVALKHHTLNPRVFGSALSGNDGGRSDLDLLVEPLPGTTLLDLGAIQIELEEALGIAVDVLTPGDLPMKFRDRVLKDAVPV